MRKEDISDSRDWEALISVLRWDSEDHIAESVQSLNLRIKGGYCIEHTEQVLSYIDQRCPVSDHRLVKLLRQKADSLQRLQRRAKEINWDISEEAMQCLDVLFGMNKIGKE